MRKSATWAPKSGARGMPGPAAVRLSGRPRWPPFLLTVPVRRQPRFRLGVARGIPQEVSGFPSGATAITLTIEAIYENGALKPAQPLPLKEHETVHITIEPQLSWAERTAGMLKWTGDFEDRRIVEDEEFGIREAR
jgi:predicted DNA-binding antitoxin AbrB/MazE fold protein